MTDVFKNLLRSNGIEFEGELYHHSDKENRYGTTVEKVDEDGVLHELLPLPLTDSIKNPMFNKAMSVLRRLTNHLITEDYIDEDTEVIVEVARELNDNNKRVAIEKYQRERESNREKYRQFLQQYQNVENPKNSDIELFTLWNEQIFDEHNKGIDEKKDNGLAILGVKDAVDRYELWVEQKGQCMYTGKMISISQLFSRETDFEHTIPRSILPDNTLTNQTICFKSYNTDVKKKKLPMACPNYESDTPEGTAILPRLDKWKDKRDYYQEKYEANKKPKGNEDETSKSKRIQAKHYFKMHYDYWKDKLDRFAAEEVNDGWARKQLVDTQMVSKYAREFLKTKFKKVIVQKGSVTADFRKIYKFQDDDEIKSRKKHTHHAIDAAVLTLIPTNASYRDRLIRTKDEWAEAGRGQFTTNPIGFPEFNSQELIKTIEENTLVVNYWKDKILQQTFKRVRKRGRKQYLKKDGQFVLDDNGNKIELWMKGDSVRSDLFADTFIGKIKNIKRKDGKPLRDEKGNWQYETGENEYKWVTRKGIDVAKTEDIVDPEIRRIVKEQGKNATDPQGKKIRHVRVYTKKGRRVKERLNYQSKHDHKNHYYAASGSIPYAIMLEKIVDEKPERGLIPIPSFQIAEVYKEYNKFNVDLFLSMFHEELMSEYPNKKLLKVGQKVLVLKNEEEFEKRNDMEFQKNRLYKVTKFEPTRILLQYHLIAQSITDYGAEVKRIKSAILEKEEDRLEIKKMTENLTIENGADRKKDFEKRLYDFEGRLKTIQEKSDEENMRLWKSEIKKYKAEDSQIYIDKIVPFLKLTQKGWNFLYENHDFDVSIVGELVFKED